MFPGGHIMRLRKSAIAGLAALAILGAGCGSAKSSSASGGTGGGSSGSGAVTTVGLFGDFTGLSASGNKTSSLGVQAGIYEAGKEGVKIKYVKADTQTSPTGALSAAQQLVEQDHVSAVIAVSALTFLAANYFKQHDIPVVGLAEDGGEWATDTNMFSTYGFLDPTKASTRAEQIGQGVYFTLSFEPVEMDTPATRQFQAALKATGVTGEPTYAEYGGYTSVALLVQALEKTGANPSHAALISALSGITSFNAWGLLGSHNLSMANRAASSIGVDGCGYYTKLVGSKFQLVPGADPLCGTEIPGH